MASSFLDGTAAWRPCFYLYDPRQLKLLTEDRRCHENSVPKSCPCLWPSPSFRTRNGGVTAFVFQASCVQTATLCLWIYPLRSLLFPKPTRVNPTVGTSSLAHVLLYLFDQGPIHAYTGILCFSAHTPALHTNAVNNMQILSKLSNQPRSRLGSVRVVRMCVECSSNIPGVLSPLFIYTDCQHAKSLDRKVIKSYIGNIRHCRKLTA